METRIQILVVDDVDIERIIMQNAFQEDYEVLEAADGIEALQMLEVNPEVAMILLDLVMPKMDGLELLERLKRDERYNKIPVIVNTQMDRDGNEIRALELGADDFICKPYDMRIIKLRVHNLINKNVLERRKMAHDLQEVSERLENLIETVPGGIGIFKMGETIECQFLNDGISMILGYSKSEIEQKLKENKLLDFFHKDDRARLFENIKKTGYRGQETRETYRLQTKSGEYRWIQISAIRFHQNTEEPVFHAVFTDVTKERENLERLNKSVQELSYRAERDMLTGLYNRETFYYMAEDMINRNAEVLYAIVVWNIEKFKVINDLMGLKTGDSVLQKIAGVVECEAQKCRGTAGRLEADHFAMCIDYGQLDMQGLNEKLIKASQEMKLGYAIRMDAGIYLVEDNQLPVGNMCDRASLALKTIAGNYMKRYALYDDLIRKNLLMEQEIVAQMAQALENGEFFVMYQPIYDAQKEEVVSAEALVRWQHPVKGLLSPGVFIPIFEKNGFITKLDRYVWEETCKTMAEIRREGKLLVPISVNVSRLNLYSPDLLDELLALVQKYELDPAFLKLEITESAYMDNPQQLMHVITDFQQHGFKILMDDFGSGYSSLNMLKDVPIDILKIDMEFIHNLESSERAGNILNSVVHMAKWMDMDVVAEGVETRNQLEMLKQIGCEFVQGFYFSRPLKEADFMEKVQEAVPEHRVSQNGKKILLLVDENEANREEIRKILEPEYFVADAENRKQAEAIISENTKSINLFLVSMDLQKQDGFTLLKEIIENPWIGNAAVIAITAHANREDEIKALQMGARDVVICPAEDKMFRQKVSTIINAAELESANAKVHALKESYMFKQRTDDIMEYTSVGISRCIYEKNAQEMSLQLLYSNEAFWNIHNLSRNQQNRDLLKIFEETMAGGEFIRVITDLRKTIEQRKESICGLYCLRGDSGNHGTIAYTGTICYLDENIIIDIIEQDISGYGRDIQPKENAQIETAVKEALKMSDISIWYYSFETDKLERMLPDNGGQQKKHIVENASGDYISEKHFHPDDIEKVRHMYTRLLQGEKEVREVVQIRKKEDAADGMPEYSWEWRQLHTMFDQNGKSVAAVEIRRDVTDVFRQAIEYNHLLDYENAEKMEAVLYAEVNLTTNSVLESSNKWYEALDLPAGSSYSAVIEHSIEKWVYSGDKKTCMEALTRECLLRKYQEEYRKSELDFRMLNERAGQCLWYRLVIKMMHDAQSGHIFAKFLIYNINEEKRHGLAMKELAEYDILTKLYNRVSFEKHVNQMMEEQKPGQKAAFIMLDLDYFKEVNDTLGHDIGDETLIDTANSIRKTFSESEIVGRLGGDEFIVFVPKVDGEEELLSRIEEVQNLLRRDIIGEKKRVPLSASIGIAYAPDAGKRFNALYRKADEALYHAKENGRNQYSIYSPGKEQDV